MFYIPCCWLFLFWFRFLGLFASNIRVEIYNVCAEIQLKWCFNQRWFKARARVIMSLHRRYDWLPLYLNDIRTCSRLIEHYGCGPDLPADGAAGNPRQWHGKHDAHAVQRGTGTTGGVGFFHQDQDRLVQDDEQDGGRDEQQPDEGAGRFEEEGL